MRKLHLIIITVITAFLLGNSPDVNITPDYCSIPEYERSATDGNDYTVCDGTPAEEPSSNLPDYCAEDYDGPLSAEQTATCNGEEYTGDSPETIDDIPADEETTDETPDDPPITDPADLPAYCDILYFERSATDGNDYTICDNAEIDVPSYIDERDYKKIYKKDGIWYGVIDIEKRNVFAVDKGAPLDSPLPTTGSLTPNTYEYALEFAFTRDTKYLKSIDISFTRDAYCPVAMDWLCNVIGGTVPEFKSGIITYEYDKDSVPLGDSKNIEEAFGDGDITLSADPEYDYVIRLNHEVSNEEPVHITVDILQFTYVLTNAEVDDVNADIQAQYDLEVKAILHDLTLNITEKQLALDALNIEYAEYNIEYDEEITSLCLNDEMCTVEAFEDNEENVDDQPSWYDNLITTLLKGLAIIVAAFGGVSFIGIIVYLIARKSISVTGDVTWTTTKGAFHSSVWAGKNVYAGVNEVFFKPIGRGLKALGVWNIPIILAFAILILLVL